MGSMFQLEAILSTSMIAYLSDNLDSKINQIVISIHDPTPYTPGSTLYSREGYSVLNSRSIQVISVGTTLIDGLKYSIYPNLSGVITIQYF